MRQRRITRSGLILCALLAAALTIAASPAAGATFAANPASLGAIPDGLSGTCGTFSASRDVTFTVSGLLNKITNVEVALTLSPAHAFAGDVDVVLIAPDAAFHTIFSRTGATTAGCFGDSSDVAGPYTFSDLAAAPPSGGWWQAATAANATAPIPAGTYRTTAPGGTGAVDPAPATLMTPAFGATNPNGVWTLRFRDGAAGDTGTVSAAALTITAKDGIPPKTTIAKKPKKKTTSTKAVFRFKSNEAGSKFKCKLGKKPYKKCGKSKTFTVGLGKHTLKVYAVDKAGNKDATPATYSWRVVAR
jgi:subtilisin-like proprotein convertase family protein